MNVLGYGPHIRQARRDAYKAFDRHTTALLRGLAICITTGSKAEGLASYYESDRDMMCVTDRQTDRVQSTSSTTHSDNSTVCQLW
ncbi:hypothetical protein DPMN_016154 [Dreissena polymorpha]|uniref:Uncharacterized protein n=1 Tax=Dreissena polymorpha TaxID=45954 RepID=A0A9D4N955_DREPO|nr:hypothetical protein DPMN_016154 [Dreissena polymorpha]